MSYPIQRSYSYKVKEIRVTAEPWRQEDISEVLLDNADEKTFNEFMKKNYKTGEYIGCLDRKKVAEKNGGTVEFVEVQMSPSHTGMFNGWMYYELLERKTA